MHQKQLEIEAAQRRVDLLRQALQKALAAAGVTPVSSHTVKESKRPVQMLSRSASQLGKSGNLHDAERLAAANVRPASLAESSKALFARVVSNDPHFVQRFTLSRILGSPL